MRTLTRPMRSPDEASGGDPTPPQPSTAPPATAVVQSGTASEGDAAELVRLRRELKEREFRLASLEDENRRIKDVASPAKAQKKGFLDGLATFFPKVD